MKKNILILAIACVTFILILVGCSGSIDEDVTNNNDNDKNKNEDEITLYTIQSTQSGFEEWLERAEKGSGVKINWIAAPTEADARHQKISTTLSSEDDTIDIFEINDEMSASFKNTGWLEPLQDTVLTDDILSEFPQGYMEDMLTTTDGDIIGVPTYSGFLALWVDQKKLDEAGLETIENKEDFIEFLKASTKDGEYGYGGSWEKTYVFNEIATFVNLFDGDYFDWTNEGNRKAMEFMHNMVHEWEVTPIDQIADRYEQMNQKFIDGKYASVFMWGTGDDYREADRYGDDEIHMINMPEFEKRAIFTDSWSYVLNSSSKNKDAAIKFLKYAASEEGELNGWDNFLRYPARADVSQQPDFESEIKDVYTEIQTTNDINGRPMLPQTMEFITEIGTQFHNYIQNKITLDEFLENAQEAVVKYQ